MVVEVLLVMSGQVQVSEALPSGVPLCGLHQPPAITLSTKVSADHHRLHKQAVVETYDLGESGVTQDGPFPGSDKHQAHGEII